jgi:hypothetical protein
LRAQRSEAPLSGMLGGGRSGRMAPTHGLVLLGASLNLENHIFIWRDPAGCQALRCFFRHLFFLKLKKALLVITGNFIKGYFLGG